MFPTRKSLLATLAVFATGGTLAFTTGFVVYVEPQTDLPAKSDVIFVIGPPLPSRIQLAERMLDEGLSDTLLISVADTSNPLCNPQPGYTVLCVNPKPFTTQGEARALNELAIQHNWNSATVITFTPHVSRTRVLMERCYAGNLRIVADATPIPLSEWVHQFFYQSGAFVKVALTPAC